MNQATNELIVLLFWAGIIALFALRKRWTPSTTAHGQAAWASEAYLGAWRMLKGQGLILARTNSGKLIRLPTRVVHVLLCGGTGSGKGVSVILPNLLSYYRGSVIVFDCKGDLAEVASRRRAARGQRIIRLAPFSPGADRLNPLDAIPPDSPILIESARALAEALVVRTGMEHDQHWNDKAVAVISAALVACLLLFRGSERSLNTVAEIVADPQLTQAIAVKLIALGGIPARMGAELNALFVWEDKVLVPSREGASVLSSAQRHLAFLSSESAANAVASSTFSVADLCKPGITLFLQIPPDHLDAMKGLLRCWLSTLIREISRIGCPNNGEVWCVIDEASACNGLSVLEEALVRGRSAGIRLLLAYQDESQIRTAFKDKPTLLFSNTDAQIYLGATSYETAERISKSCGDFTQTISSYNDNESRSSPTAVGGPGGGPQTSRGWSENWSVLGRNLIRPEEVLTLPTTHLICFIRGMRPILAKRVLYYADAEFNPAMGRPVNLLWWLLVAAAVIVTVWALWK